MNQTPSLPSYLLPLLDLFAANGESAYPVGGCVRDTLRGLPPHDWDVAVTTPPEQTARICEAAGYRVIPTGLSHGTVTVLVPQDGTDVRLPVECTTCRTEGGYSDGRHPDAVAFTGRIEDDLSRRDFTVNAMAFERAPDGSVSILDLFGGRADLAAGIITCVGDPETRFSEDALRMLRAVRFAVQLDFDIHPATANAVKALAPSLSRISRERISAEFQKILCSAAPARGLALLRDTDLLAHILPAGYAAVEDDRLAALPATLTVRLSALLFGLSPAQAKRTLDGLRLSRAARQEIEQILGLGRTDAPALPLDPTAHTARQWRHAFGPLAVSALLVRQTHATSDPARQAIDRLIALVHRSEQAHDPVTLSELALGGRDLLALGATAGPALRALLEELLSRVLADPTLNTPERLAEEAGRLLPKSPKTDRV